MNGSPLSWNVKEWCASIGVSHGTFYNLPAELRPESVKLRERRLIIESPGAYLKRISESQRQAA